MKKKWSKVIHRIDETGTYSHRKHPLDEQGRKCILSDLFRTDGPWLIFNFGNEEFNFKLKHSKKLKDKFDIPNGDVRVNIQEDGDILIQIFDRSGSLCRFKTNDEKWEYLYGGPK